MRMRRPAPYGREPWRRADLADVDLAALHRRGHFRSAEDRLDGEVNAARAKKPIFNAEAREHSRVIGNGTISEGLAHDVPPKLAIVADRLASAVQNPRTRYK